MNKETRPETRAGVLGYGHVYYPFGHNEYSHMILHFIKAASGRKLT